MASVSAGSERGWAVGSVRWSPGFGIKAGVLGCRRDSAGDGSRSGCLLVTAAEWFSDRCAGCPLRSDRRWILRRSGVWVLRGDRVRGATWLMVELDAVNIDGSCATSTQQGYCI